MHCPHTLYLKFFTYSIIFFLHKNVDSPSYDPCLLFELPSTVQETCRRQACRQHGEMESKPDHESVGLGWRPRAGHSTSSDCSFLLWGHQCLLWLLQLSGGSWGTQSLWVCMELCIDFHRALLTTCLFSESAVQVSITSMRSGDSSEKGPHLSHRISNNGGHLALVGQHKQIWFLLNLRFSSHILLLNLRYLV